MNFPKATSNFPCCYFQNPAYSSPPLPRLSRLPFLPSYFPFADHLFQQKETFKATAPGVQHAPFPADWHSQRRFHVNNIAFQTFLVEGGKDRSFDLLWEKYRSWSWSRSWLGIMNIGRNGPLSLCGYYNPNKSTRESFCIGSLAPTLIQSCFCQLLLSPESPLEKRR